MPEDLTAPLFSFRFYLHIYILISQFPCKFLSSAMEKEQFFCGSSPAPPAVMPPGMNCAAATASLLTGIYPTLGLNLSMHNSFCFESAVSSLVSSPYFHALVGDGGGGVFSELIGQQGCVCKSDAQIPCHNTSQQGGRSLPMLKTAHFSPLAIDPGFADRAARLACFGAQNLGGPMKKEVASKIMEPALAPQETELSNSQESSSATDMIPAGGAENNSRKRKAGGKGRGKTSPLPSNDTNTRNEAEEKNSDAKRRRAEQSGDGGGLAKESNAKPQEPPKDYIHVRARRGQATDSHSLAERVRREKISERMKQLQDLVPGCSKISGKALLLDEIINYVQSLQRQVELLSTKLATLNPQMASLKAGYMNPCLPHPVFSPSTIQMPREHGAPPLAGTAFSYAQPPQNLDMQLPLDPLDSLDGFAVADAICQFGNQWGDDLECVVRMGFVQER